MHRPKLVLFSLAAMGTAALAFPRSAAADSAPRTHDGFYLSMSLGPAYVSSTASEVGQDVSVRGWGAGVGLLVGGTVAPGLVLGGGTVGSVAFSPSLKVGGVSFDSTSDTSLTAGLLGPFVSYYFDPHAGLHLDGLVGLATLKSANDKSESDTASGFGAAIGFGDEWWVGDQWSIGVLGRLMASSTKLNGSTYTTITPGILASFTYH